MRFLFLFLLSPIFVFAQNFPLWENLKSGPHAVGFKKVLQYDYSRTYGPANARPIQTLIWYPAEKPAKQKLMSMRDYVHLWAQEEDFTPLNDERKAFAENLAKEWIYSEEGDTTLLESILNKKVGAYVGAKQLEGKYPLIIYGASFSSPAFENSVLCELLASHGYIVVACPSASENYPWMSEDPQSAYTQARDLSFLLAYMRKFPGVDLDQIGTFGFSFGGMANAILASENPQIKALVGLDGMVSYFLNYLPLPIQVYLPSFNPIYMRISTMEMIMMPNERFVYNDYFEKEMEYSDFHLFRWKKADHHNFASFYIQMLKEPIPNYEDLQGFIQRYRVVAERVLAFFNDKLKGDNSYWKKLNDNEEYNSLYDYTFNESDGDPITEMEFFYLVREGNMDNIKAAYESVRTDFPDYPLFRETKINGLIRSLWETSEYERRLLMMEYRLDYFPNNPTYYYDLVDLIFTLKGKEEALKRLVKALELFPEDEDLMELKSTIEE